MKTAFLVLSVGCIATFFTGCAGGRSDFSPPAYQAQTPYQTAQTYNLHQAINQTPPQAPPPQPAAPMSNPPSTVQPAAGTPTLPGAVASSGMAAQAASPMQPEIIPPSPGPDYVWMPSYWTIGVGGSWVWVGGHYVIRRGVSEEQLRAARGMLEQARVGLTGGALKETDKAIDRINEALHEYRHE